MEMPLIDRSGSQCRDKIWVRFIVGMHFCGIAWLVDLNASVLSVCSDPSATDFKDTITVEDLTTVIVPLKPSAVIDLSGLFRQ